MKYIFIWTIIRHTFRQIFKPWMMSSKWRTTYRIISAGMITIARATCRNRRFLEEHTKCTLKNIHLRFHLQTIHVKSLHKDTYVSVQIVVVYNRRKCKHAPSWISENMHNKLTSNCHLEATRNCLAWSSWHPVANINWFIITCCFKPSITFICAG